MTERMDLYIGVVVTLMFLAGCFFIVVSVRKRSEERRRWQHPTAVESRPARKKASDYEPEWKSGANS